MVSYELDINFNTDTSGIEEARDILSEMRDVAEEVGASISNIDNSGLEDMGESASTTKDNLGGASDEMDGLKEKTEETNESMKETADSSAGIGTALTGIAGAMGLDMMITKADNINTSWNQLSLTFANTGVSMDTLKSKSAELSSETGRSGTQVRDYFNQMGIAGITNVDLLSTSFKNMTGRAYQTGSSVEQMESSVQRMVMSGNAGAKMLSRLGISSTALADALGVTEDQAEATFKSLSTEERLDALNKAMGDGTEANEMYKNSYAGLKEQAEISIGGLMSTIGQSILPVVIPAIKMATDGLNALKDMVKGLPQPLMSVFGIFGGGIVAVTTVVGTLGALGKVGSSVVGGLKSMKKGFDTLKGALSTAKKMTDALRTAESVSEGVRSALAIATGAEAVAEEGSAVAKGSAVGPTTALSVAENSLLLPILLVVGAIVGLIAVLWYLYNNNEQVKQGIDSLIATFKGVFDSVMSLVGAVITAIIPVIQDVLMHIQNIINIFTTLIEGDVSLEKAMFLTWMQIQNIIQTVTQFIIGILSSFAQALWTFIFQGFTRAKLTIITQVNLWKLQAIQGVTSMVSGIVSKVTSLPQRIGSAISGVTSRITKPFTDAYNTIKPIINKVKEAWNLLNKVGMSGYEGWDDSSLGYEGWDGNALNSSLSQSVNNAQQSQINNFNINGIIEEEASRYIIDSVNSELRRQRLIRGV